VGWGVGGVGVCEDDEERYGGGAGVLVAAMDTVVEAGAQSHGGHGGAPPSTRGAMAATAAYGVCRQHTSTGTKPILTLKHTQHLILHDLHYSEAFNMAFYTYSTDRAKVPIYAHIYEHVYT
jgi:hypothetical protein